MGAVSADKLREKNTKTVMDKHAGPSEAYIQLISPDGYYTYLGIPKPSPSDIQKAAENVSSSFAPKENQAADKNDSAIDEDLVKKSYRKLSLKHHPDKRGGDAETFRVLNRAQKVLLNPKLRQQYDILGLDLDDDDEEHDNLHSGTREDGEEETASQGIVHEIATQVMAGLMHLAIRTLMMCVTSVFVTYYRILLFPALLFMFYVAYQLLLAARLPDNHPSKGPMHALSSPIMIVFGLLLMYWGRTEVTEEDGKHLDWTWMFWIGETMVLGTFMWNSVAGTVPGSPITIGAIGVISSIAALWFRGRFWNYVIVLAFEGLLILVVVMAFPVIEMLLETILNEKLRKVGDKVRAHQKQLEAYYANKRDK